ncbi:MAG: sugar kinase [Clostridiales bacterium]|jgi:2-dehydro-3-deoxygluconokinase|nr:sugar kinase [Clostridiales bacterium]
MKVVTFGEIMLRLTPPGYARFLQADAFTACYGGAEANVAAGLASLGVRAEFVTRLPQNDIGRAALNSLRRYGVETGNVATGGGRLGIYFLEKGAGARSANVIYDRADSGFASAKDGDFDWNKIFDGADWFHLSGVTPALSAAMPAICLNAVRTAKEKGLTVSFDVNYRAKLWSVKKAAAALSPLLPYVTVFFGTDWDARGLFGAPDLQSLIKTHTLQTAAHSVRGGDTYAGVLYSGGKVYRSKTHTLAVIDRIGAGDAFCAGLIYALTRGKDAQEAIELAAAAAVLKHTTEGDTSLAGAEEIERAANGGSSGVVLR